MQQDSILTQLVTMSNHLGDPALDCAILGEGNTSACADGDTFWVKASGTELRTIDRAGFVRVSFERALALLDAPDLSDEEVKQRIGAAKVDLATGVGPAADDGVRPSVETVLHAICLNLEGVNFVGHTHPTAINAILCSRQVEEAVSGRLFPDQVIYCGPASVYILFTDPGVPLARKVGDSIDQYIDEYREVPKVILMQNRGLIALGGPRFFSLETVARINTRPDELYRRRVLGEKI
jgi:rhamnose utilization protein RhaD (predicted bifunctional aldolase and dehydrogenase)